MTIDRRKVRDLAGRKGGLEELEALVDAVPEAIGAMSRAFGAELDRLRSGPPPGPIAVDFVAADLLESREGWRRRLRSLSVELAACLARQRAAALAGPAGPARRKAAARRRALFDRADGALADLKAGVALIDRAEPGLKRGMP
jgi:hypothetical protein